MESKMNEAIKHQQAAMEEIMSVLSELIHYEDARIISAFEHLERSKEIIGDSDAD
jgi:hypothetical protein